MQVHFMDTHGTQKASISRLTSVQTTLRELLMPFNQFGFAWLGLNKQDLLEADVIIQLGYPPNRIDLLTYPQFRCEILKRVIQADKYRLVEIICEIITFY